MTNKAKHGIDFDEAQALWHDPERLEIPANTTDEPRYLVIGMIGGKHWSHRGDLSQQEYPFDFGQAFTKRGGGIL